MIRIRELRVWTALIVMGLSAYVLRQAWTLLSFGFAEALATPQNFEERLQRFVAAPIVASQARLNLLRFTQAADAATHVEDLTDFLTLRPLASGAWLDLAAAKFAASAGADEVAASLTLSNLTGPNEAYLMAARAVFGLPLWTSLPPDSRRSVLSDLVGGWGGVDESHRVGLKAALARAGGKTREEVRAALLLVGKPAIAIEKALDLKPAPASNDDSRMPPALVYPRSVVAPPAPTGPTAPPVLAPPANGFSLGGNGR